MSAERIADFFFNKAFTDGESEGEPETIPKQKRKLTATEIEFIRAAASPVEVYRNGKPSFDRWAGVCDVDRMARLVRQEPVLLQTIGPLLIRVAVAMRGGAAATKFLLDHDVPMLISETGCTPRDRSGFVRVELRPGVYKREGRAHHVARLSPFQGPVRRIVIGLNLLDPMADFVRFSRAELEVIRHPVVGDAAQPGEKRLRIAQSRQPGQHGQQGVLGHILGSRVRADFPIDPGVYQASRSDQQVRFEILVAVIDRKRDSSCADGRTSHKPGTYPLPNWPPTGWRKPSLNGIHAVVPPSTTRVWPMM